MLGLDCLPYERNLKNNTLYLISALDFEKVVGLGRQNEIDIRHGTNK